MTRRPLPAPAALAVACTLLASCGDDGTSQPSPTTAPPTAPPTTAPATTVPPTTGPTTTAPTTTVPTTTAPPTTVPPRTWEPVGAMPSLAYIPCCASNYQGEPSPPIPADPSQPLDPGLYHAARTQPEPGNVETSTITFDLSPFVTCGEPGIMCEEPFADGDVGVGPVVREVTVPLDAAVEVVVGGFRCEGDVSFDTEHMAGDGTMLAALQTAFDADYARAVGSKLSEGATPDDIVAAISAAPTDGFTAPACSGAGSLVYQPASGPGLLLQALTAWDPARGAPVVPVSASVEWLRLTALQVDPSGAHTLFFYAGFLS